jgi:MFS family permease
VYKRLATSVGLIATVAARCELLFGDDTGVISGALLLFRKDFVLSLLLEGVVTSAVVGGGVVGAGFSGRLADRFGCRRMILAVAVLFFVSSLIAALARSVGWAGLSSASRSGLLLYRVLSEIYKLPVHGLATGIRTVANWGFNLVVARTFLLLARRWARLRLFRI